MRPSAVLPLLICIACGSEPGEGSGDALPPPATGAGPSAWRPPSLEGLIDVSGDDCTSSAFVYDVAPVAESNLDAATPFINDGCIGDRIFLGVNGERRELRRAENVPLGTGGEYSDGVYRVRVTRGRLVSRTVSHEPPDAQCQEPNHRELELVYAAEVAITAAGVGSRTIQGTLVEPSCAL